MKKEYGNFVYCKQIVLSVNNKYGPCVLESYASTPDKLFLGINEERGLAIISDAEDFVGLNVYFHLDKTKDFDSQIIEFVSKTSSELFKEAPATKEGMREWAGLSPSTKEINNKIKSIYEAMADLNVYKNTQYGNIGSNPLNIFARYMDKSTPALNGIYQRLDDKLSRIKNCPEKRPRINDVVDAMGYLNLLLVNLGVTKEDIAKFKD